MRKLPILCLASLLFLGACSSNNRSDKELQNTYNSFVDSILDNNGTETKDIPFTHTLSVKLDNNGKYRYEITIEDARIAMYNIQMMIVDRNVSSDYPYIGLAKDDVFHMVPNQENKDKSFMKNIILGGTSENAVLSLDVQVTWKDYAQVNTQTVFFHYDYVAEHQAPINEEEGNEE